MVNSSSSPRFEANMARSMISEESYDYEYVLDLLDCIKKPGTNIETVLLEAIKYDEPEKPLPFELIQEALRGLDEAKAKRFLSVAKDLQIWKEQERAVLLFQWFRRQQQQESGDWREHLIPLVGRIWATAPRGTKLRGWAACWLAEQSLGEQIILLEALIEARPGVTSPGHYVRRLKLWKQQQKRVEAVLPKAVCGLADAWGLLGKERLADRAAVVALLALALQSRSPVAARRLREELEILVHILSERDGSNELRAALDVLQSLPLPESALVRLGQYEDPFTDLLKGYHASEALRQSERTELPSDANDCLRLAILTSEAARRARSSSAALKILEHAGKFLAEARPETAWAFHYLKAGLHWSQISYHAALLEVEEARRLTGETGSSDLLYETHVLRRRIARNLRLVQVQVESDTVLDILDQMRAIRKMPPGKREEISFMDALGVEAPSSRYREVLQRLRELRKSWRTSRNHHGHLSTESRAYYSKALRSVAQECDQALPSEINEPLLFGQMRFDQAQLALEARIEWDQNPELYSATLKPWLDDACRIAQKLEAYKLLNVIQKEVNKHRNGALRQYEVPHMFACHDSAWRYDLERVSRLLRAASTSSERRGILGSANAEYSKYLSGRNVNSLGSEEALVLLEILQDLKQPSFEENRAMQWQKAKVTEAIEEDLPLDEEIISDDLDITPQEGWRDAVAQRMIREGALCLDFFLTNDHLYCFTTENLRGQLDCRILSLDVPWKGKLKKRISLWRSKIRAVIEQPGVIVDVSDLNIVAAGLEKELQRSGHILPGPLEEILGSRHAGIVYVAPFLGLYGLPLHALRAKSGWSLSRVGTVFQVLKTSQLAVKCQTSTGSKIKVLTGPEDDFRNTGRKLAEQVGATLADPRTRQELLEILDQSKIVVLLGHGWFDKQRPTRSRIALDHGLRLTLKDIQDLELKGVEIVLLSCWTGWSVRGDLPIGELYSGPASWILKGAGAVLAPLWPIPIDAGYRFISDYLEARSRGETRANALRRAREQSINYTFGGLCCAAYVLWGTDSP